MEHQPIEKMECFRLFEEVADWVWAEVATWSVSNRMTVGDQLVRAVDSINANLVEGDGRYTIRDSVNFFVIARASAREARLWLARSIKRMLVAERAGAEQITKLELATKLLNHLITYRRNSGFETREPVAIFGKESSSPVTVENAES